VFGEMALLTGGRRTADVTAIDYCELLALERSDFRQFLRKYPRLRHQVDDLVAKRSEMNRQPAQAPKVET
jgi:CPA2 family monovalent cation:H+ antiporter-2